MFNIINETVDKLEGANRFRQEINGALQIPSATFFPKRKMERLPDGIGERGIRQDFIFPIFVDLPGGFRHRHRLIQDRIISRLQIFELRGQDFFCGFLTGKEIMDIVHVTTLDEPTSLRGNKTDM